MKHIQREVIEFKLGLVPKREHCRNTHGTLAYFNQFSPVEIRQCKYFDTTSKCYGIEY